MAIRVDVEGIQTILDGVGAGATGSGVPIVDDGTRDAPYMDRPWANRNEAYASDAMRLMAIPGEQLAQIRPPVPYMLFPPDQRMDNTPLTIMEVLDVDRFAPQQRSWVSPTVRMNERTATTDGGDGTARNISRSGNPFG